MVERRASRASSAEPCLGGLARMSPPAATKSRSTSLEPLAQTKETEVVTARCGLDVLQILPKFRPPDFDWPLPVPESPEVMPSTPQNVTRGVNSEMITWVDAAKPAQ